MFSLISGFLKWYFEKPTFQILIIGEENTGKTTYLEQLKLIYTGAATPFKYIVPTTGLNLITFKYNDIELKFWDVSGKQSLRKLWETYYEELDAIIYVLDASSPQVDKSINILNDVLKDTKIQNAEIPILILINKIDSIKLDKNKIDSIYKSIDYEHLKLKHFLVKDISALKNVRVDESIRWLYNSLQDFAKGTDSKNDKNKNDFWLV